MKSAKKSILKAVAKVGAKSAEIGASSASILGFHQPKEPEGSAEPEEVRKYTMFSIIPFVNEVETNLQVAY